MNILREDLKELRHKAFDSLEKMGCDAGQICVFFGNPDVKKFFDAVVRSNIESSTRQIGPMVHKHGSGTIFTETFCGCGGQHWDFRDFPKGFIDHLNKILTS